MAEKQIDDDRQIEIAQAYWQGASIRKIADDFGINSRVLYSIIDSLGIPRRRAQYTNQRKQVKQPKSVGVVSLHEVEQLKSEYGFARHERLKAEHNLVRAQQKEQNLASKINTHLTSLQQALDGLRIYVEQDENHETDIEAMPIVIQSVVLPNQHNTLDAIGIEHNNRSKGQQERRQAERDEKITLDLPLK